jgi:hypothetical protein
MKLKHHIDAAGFRKYYYPINQEKTVRPPLLGLPPFHGASQTLMETKKKPGDDRRLKTFPQFQAT